MDPDDDRETVGAVVDAGVGVDLGGGGVAWHEDVEVEAIFARLRSGKDQEIRRSCFVYADSIERISTK